MAESFVERRKRELGLTPSTAPSVTKVIEKPQESDFVTKRKMELGLIPDTRAQDAQTKLTTQYKAATANKNQFYDDNINNAPIIQHNDTTPDVIPTWNGPLDNPITRTAGKGLGVVGKAYDKVSHVPVVNQATGAGAGAFAELAKTDKPKTNKPLWKDILENAKDVVHIGQTLQNPANLVTDLFKDKGIKGTASSILKAPISAVKGVFNPDEARQDLNKSLEDKSVINKLIIGSVADPLSYVPLPSIKSIKTASSAVSEAFEKFAARNKEAPIDFEQYMQASKNRNEVSLGQIDRGEQSIVDKFNFINKQMGKEAPLQLNPSRAEVRQNTAQARSTLQPNTTPIQGRGTVETMALPASNTPRIVNDIKKQAEALIKPPTNRRGLIAYAEQHLEVPNAELVRMNDKDLYELGQMIRSSTNMDTVQAKLAAEQGHNWAELVSGKSVTGNVESPLNRLQFKPVTERAKPLIGSGGPAGEVAPKIPKAKPRATIKAFVENNEVAATTVKPKVTPVARAESVVKPPVVKASSLRPTSDIRRTVTARPDEIIKGQQLKELKTGDETGFAQTVKNSDNTSPELSQALNERPVVGARTTDVLNRQEAAKLIEKHGKEVLYSKLISKRLQFSASETTAAQILAKHYSSLGGKENLTKAIELVSKTAQGGREMGQAIQALSQWNKLDETGALLLGEKQLNKGVRNSEDWKTLTPEQGAPITAAAQRIEKAQATKDLADDVLNIVTNKKAGEALTDAEKATVKEFQSKVKEINEKGKGILSSPKVDKANETIKEVSKVEPKKRTRDQVVSFLDAKAEKARQRIAASRNMGFAAVNKGNPVIDYAIIGASHIAKGVVKLSDFTEAMVRDYGQSVKPHVNEAFTKATNIFRRENGLPTIEHLDRVVRNAVKNDRFTAEEASHFKAWASEIGYMSDKFKIEATQDLQAALKELGDSTIGQQLATVQTGAMLLNSVTLERNVIGNMAQMIGEKISKTSTLPIDYAMSKLTGERTVVFKPMNQEKFWRNFMAGTVSNWKGVSPNGMLDSYGIHANVFSKRNPLKYISKSLGATLGGFDHAFYSAAKGDVLATYAERLGKAQGMTRAEIKAGMKELIVSLDDRIHELADHAGKYATYQDETILSQGADLLRKGLNEASTGYLSRKLVDMGMSKKLSLEGFGAGDVVMKFAKTPANLIMRGIDYSPIGFVRSLADLGYFIAKRERFNQHEAVRTLGRAITGTLGLTGMGYVLADAGILTGSSSLDKDVRSIQEQSGQGAYKVNFSALRRFIMGGLDYKAAKYQKGDHLMDYQWLQPAAISVAMGVNANKSIKDNKNGADASGWQIAKKAVLGGIGTILENPMVQGINTLIDASMDIVKKQDPKKLKAMGKGIPASFVPTLLNQWRTSTDNKQRETFSKDMLTEMGNLMANKVPGLSNNLPVSYDSLGNEREKIQGGKEGSIGQYLTAFFSPARMTEYDVSDEAKLVLDLMDKSGDANVLPRIAPKTFKVKQGKNEKDLTVTMDAKQFSKFQKNLGEMVKAKLALKAAYLSNDSISLENKVKKVKEILTDVGAKARETIGTEMGYKKKDIKG